MANVTAGFTLDTWVRKKIDKLRRKEKDVRVHNRLSALLWVVQGRAPEEVAELLGVCPRTVRNWLQLYKRGGLEALCTLAYKGDPGGLRPCQLDRVKGEVATGRFNTARQACDRVETTFGRRFSPSGVRKLLHRLGCSFHRVSGFLLKADPHKQQEFLGDYEEDRQKARTEGWRRYFVDGAHPVYGLEVLFGCWLVVGQRFEVGVGGGRQRLNILGAYCPEDHEYLDRRYTEQNLNAQSLIELFTLLMARHPETKRFRIYLDNARYHHAKLLRQWIAALQQERGVVFDLRYLPAYSPNLNLIERLWKFLRKEALQKWHATFADMQQAVGEVLDHLDRYAQQLASLMTERFHLSPRVEVVVVGVGQAA
jgi:transposase